MTETDFGKHLFDFYFEFLDWPMSCLISFGMRSLWLACDYQCGDQDVVASFFKELLSSSFTYSQSYVVTVWN